VRRTEGTNSSLCAHRASIPAPYIKFCPFKSSTLLNDPHPHFQEYHIDPTSQQSPGEGPNGARQYESNIRRWVWGKGGVKQLMMRRWANKEILAWCSRNLNFARISILQNNPAPVSDTYETPHFHTRCPQGLCCAPRSPLALGRLQADRAEV
jgi:hypothetical protein